MSARRWYNLCAWCLLPLVLLRLSLLGARDRGYLRGWAERFGRPSRLRAPDAGRIWLHAVSVGEIQAARPLLQRLPERFPGRRLLVTTTTPSGARILARLGDAMDMDFAYLPFDLSFAVAAFLDRCRPELAIVMETEIWPNLFVACRDRGIPLVLANARLSDRSLAGYRRLPALFREAFEAVSLVAAQDDQSASRYRELGVPASKLRVTGNIKFDIAFPPDMEEDALRLRHELFADRVAWIAASTHEGEEREVLRAFRLVEAEHPGSLLILAPRHPWRQKRVLEECRRAGYPRVFCRSQGSRRPLAEPVLLLDTLGELPLFYAASEVAFVGGSLVAHGGQNPLEPAALGVPVIAGPHYANFSSVVALLREAGAAWIVRDHRELAGRVSQLLADEVLRRLAGGKGREIVARHRGAADRLLRELPLAEEPEAAA